MSSTMRDVARLAGVSTSTVSQVFNARAGVSPDSVRRVLGAADSLGYKHRSRPRQASDRLVRRIGFVVHGSATTVARPYYAALLAGAAGECDALDIRVVYWPLTDAPGADRLGDEGLDGLVLAGPVDPVIFDHLRALHLPLVVTGNAPYSVPCDRVLFDDPAGSQAAAGLLARLGHRRLAVVYDASRFGSGQSRVDAFLAAAARTADTSVELHEVPALPDGPGDSFPVAQRMLAVRDGATGRKRDEAEPGGVTAVFCTSDRLALNVLRAAWEQRRPVPESLSVVGFNDFDAAAHANPPLTTVRTDIELMGRTAVRRLLERAREPETPPLTITIGVELIERSSVARAPDFGHGDGCSGVGEPSG
jgi:LacI family transcriptional regulator